MAKGDVKSDLKSVAAGQYLDIKPPEGEEWVINNIYYSGSVELYFTDGTISIRFDSSFGSGGHLNYNWHLTSSRWISVKNVDTTTINIGYDGVAIK